MSWLNPIYIVPLLVLTAVIVMIVARRVSRAAARTRRRVVEPPNSHFTSQLVRDHEALTRWRNIALDRIHEVNRGEVVRLLARVETTGVESLTPAERAFLDQLATGGSGIDPQTGPGRWALA